ncbi:unnamed protein product [Wuchereria bancrofti]|uniref:BZIP domain-containing protein n=1 Tax=Wuchereria bancrofti TaxID=6293 RepID=A0A3P7EVY8_WUCBA|nr:unnamed protein product [Wuchereria bancrofti]
MILKDLETVDKQLKKEPDEQSVASVVIQPSAEPVETVRSQMSLRQDPNAQLSEQQAISSRLEQELGQTAGSSSGPVPGMLSVNAEVLGLKTMSAGGDGQQQQYVPSNQGTSQGSDWQSTVISGYTSSPSPLGMAGGSRTTTESDDSTRKRQVRLLKNREAAKECRRKKKEYVKCLENRVAVLENQNKALIEELKTLKELYCRKEKSEI